MQFREKKFVIVHSISKELFAHGCQSGGSVQPPRRVVTKLRNVVFVPAMELLPQERGGSVNFSWVAADAGGRAADAVTGGVPAGLHRWPTSRDASAPV